METKKIKKKLSIINSWNLKTGDVIKSYKSRGMKKYEKEYKSYEAFNDDTPIINIEKFVVERSFNSSIVKDSRYIRLQKDDEDRHFIFPLDTKFKCYRINDNLQ